MNAEQLVNMMPDPMYLILVEKKLNNFTPIECVVASYGRSEDAKLHEKYYGLVYSRLNKMVRAGLLKRDRLGKTLQNPIYIRTPKFDEMTLIDANVLPVTKDVPNKQYMKRLKEKVREYKNNIQECIGECEEYKQLGNEFPELKTKWHVSYLSSYNNLCMLKGKLHVVESILASEHANK